MSAEFRDSNCSSRTSQVRPCIFLGVSHDCNNLTVVGCRLSCHLSIRRVWWYTSMCVCCSISPCIWLTDSFEDFTQVAHAHGVKVTFTPQIEIDIRDHITPETKLVGVFVVVIDRFNSLHKDRWLTLSRSGLNHQVTQHYA